MFSAGSAFGYELFQCTSQGSIQLSTVSPGEGLWQEMTYTQPTGWEQALLHPRAKTQGFCSICMIRANTQVPACVCSLVSLL